ncbi:MAG: hypothetical protein JNG90_02195 [Planctomycetaceae bacterium]|nr:hypothetical protein [Planctomycetaceae bacterium]
MSARCALTLVVAGSVVAGLLGAGPLAVGAEPPGGGHSYFRIRVVDDQTGRGVPLVELKTVDNVKYYTDSAGLVAFDEPAQMNREVFFAVASHGYEMPADGFGIRGKILLTAPGGEAEIRIKRLNIAERLYRVTGAGIYRDTILAGGNAPLAEPLLNAQVVGSDSVQAAIFQGELWWFWGDTNRPKYPLGNFHVPGASSKLPTDGGLAPEVGVDLNYLVNEECFARATCQMEGDGPTWIDALTVVPAADGSEQMFAGYMKVRKLLEVYRRGIARWDAAAHKFVHAADIPLDAPALPHGHALRTRDGSAEYVSFGNPFPLTRVPATAEALLDLAQYENYTPLKEGTRLSDKQRERGQVTSAQLDRTADGQLRWSWKRGTSYLDQRLERRLHSRGDLKPGEERLQLVDAGTKQPVRAHGGSVAWNPWRQRFVMICNQAEGKSSNLGEVWYAEAAELTGPWREARRIVSHDKYTFYNPRQHPYFANEDGRVIYFEGTYSTFFSGNTEQTPRYDYNQIMYRLDLADPRLGLLEK